MGTEKHSDRKKRVEEGEQEGRDQGKTWKKRRDEEKENDIRDEHKGRSR